MALSNQSGQLAERYGYTPYGKRRVVSPGGAMLASSAVGNQVGFTGRYHDAETGLTYFRARYQDAELGRFVGRDPIAFRDFGVKPRRLRAIEFQANLYVYALGNPVEFLDPQGEKVNTDRLSPAGQHAYEESKAYLDTAGDNALARLDALPETVYLTENSSQDTSFHGPGQYTSGERTINWDPNSGNAVNGGVQSPALGLLHEAAHAENQIRNPDAFYERAKGQDLLKYGVTFPNAEEGFVTLGEEARIAKALGEPVRDDYLLDPVRVPRAVPNQCR